MRRLTLLFALLALFTFGALAEEAAPQKSDDGTSESNPPAESTQEGDTFTCESQSAEEIVKEWLKNQRRKVTVQDCPATRTCAGGTTTCGGISPCRTVGGGSSVDLGISKCRQDDGQLFNCTPSGQTVHLTTVPCGQCPCCSAQPACVCPINCGSHVTLSCQ